MIHGGLNIFLKQNGKLQFNHCCLSDSTLQTATDSTLIWDDPALLDLREKNKKNIWDQGCRQCNTIESVNSKSFRTTQLSKFGINESLSGPQRIDLLFDRSCNLACLYCGPESSTYWQKYNQENKIPQILKYQDKTTKNQIFEILKNLNLENIKQIQFCGGETLLGNTYIDTAKYISELIPEESKSNFELAFQTNGTQPWRDEFYEIFERFQSVKIDISLDCTEKRFEYSRWPASWNQVTENILEIREKAPPNVMFMFQEVITNMSLFYVGENKEWVDKNFKNNRVSDPTSHNVQLVNSPFYDIKHITEEYVDAIKNTNTIQYLNSNWTENPVKINQFLKDVTLHDSIRGLDWKVVYPEVAEFFKRYI